jgi:hypothetical protein
MFVSTHIMAESSVIMHPKETSLDSLALVHELKSTPPAPNIEDLRTYHLALDQLDSLMFPDVEDECWQHVKTIKKESIQTEVMAHNKHTYLKVQYSDASSAYQTLDTVRLHDPIIIAKYGISNSPVETLDWEWIPHYIQQSPVHIALNTVLKNSLEQGKKFKHQMGGT